MMTVMNDYAALHEKNLFAATAAAGIGRRTTYQGFELVEKEADLLQVFLDGTEVVRLQHGMVHSCIVVFSNSGPVKELLAENGITDEIILQQDTDVYPEVAPCAVWMRRLRIWWNDNPLTQWTLQPMRDAYDENDEWAHAIYTTGLAI